VQAPGRLVPLLHRRDQRRRARPQHRDGCIALAELISKRVS
jgi:hypothetical protein